MAAGGKRKFDPSDLPATSDADLIRTQIEFYFSDANLPYDTFLMNATRKNEGGWVDLETIGKFKRMKRFLPLENVKAALVAQTSEVVEVDEDGSKVRRRHPLTQRKMAEVNERSVYAKGFGEEGKHTQIAIEGYFEQFGSIKAVRLRRDGEGAFKGSVFAEYAEVSGRDAFLEDKRAYEGKDLVAMAKTEYIEMKKEQHKDDAPVQRKRKNNVQNKAGKRQKRGDKEKKKVGNIDKAEAMQKEEKKVGSAEEDR